MRIKAEIHDVLYFFSSAKFSQVKPELLKCSIKRLEEGSAGDIYEYNYNVMRCV